MVEIVVAAGPGIVINAAEAGEKEQRSAIVGGGVLNFLASAFRVDGHRFEPIRNPFMHILLEKCLASDAIGITAQHERPAAKERQNKIGHSIIVGEEIPFGETGVRKINLVEVAEAKAFAIEFDGDGLCFAKRNLLAYYYRMADFI